MKVKPFYIRITDDMTPQMVQDAFDKCVDAGADAFECVSGAETRIKYERKVKFGAFSLFGVDRHEDTYFAKSPKAFSLKSKQITLDQLDEWLGLKAEQEWKLGDKCVLAGNEYTFGCVNPICDQGSVVIFDDTGDYHGCCVNELSKPEAPEQKAERERLEAAKELYYESNKVMSSTDMVNHYNFDQSKDVWLAIVDKTGYRKEK